MPTPLQGRRRSGEGAVLRQGVGGADAGPGRKRGAQGTIPRCAACRPRWLQAELEQCGRNYSEVHTEGRFRISWGSRAFSLQFQTQSSSPTFEPRAARPAPRRPPTASCAGPAPSSAAPPGRG